MSEPAFSSMNVQHLNLPVAALLHGEQSCDKTNILNRVRVRKMTEKVVQLTTVDNQCEAVVKKKKKRLLLSKRMTYCL